MKGWKKIFHANVKEKKARTLLISDKIDFKTKIISKGKEGHYIMIKGSIQQENITFANIYTTNIGVPKYIKQILIEIKGETDNNTIILGDITPYLHQWTDHINKEILALNDTLDQIELIDREQSIQKW